MRDFIIMIILVHMSLISMVNDFLVGLGFYEVVERYVE